MARKRLSGLRRFSGLWFGRPDKAQPPSGGGVAVIMPDGAYRLSGLGGFSGVITGYSGAPPSPCAEGHFQPRTSGRSSPCSRTYR